jgi:Ser/Thr protein kinase RdoA (MazF antagonist)
METDNEPIAQLARAALERFGIEPDASVTLINVSENHTYRVEDPVTRDRYALRVHRPGYRTVPQIESELDWVEALRDGGVAQTPAARAAGDGSRVVSASALGVEPRNVVVFEWLDGAEVDLDSGDAATGQFEILGSISARMHRHVRSWQPPSRFIRPRWDYEYSIGPRGHWGAWQDGLGIGAEERRQLQLLDATIAARLDRYGQGEHRFGLIHADMRLANLLIDGDEVYVIDFDDCGFSWFMYDFATAVSFMEDHPRVPELRDAWVRGYRSVTELGADDEAELQTFVMLRRLLLVAWIGSHHTFAPEATELGGGYTAGTCALAEEYLSTYSTS